MLVRKNGTFPIPLITARTCYIAEISSTNWSSLFSLDQAHCFINPLAGRSTIRGWQHSTFRGHNAGPGFHCRTTFIYPNFSLPVVPGIFASLEQAIALFDSFSPTRVDGVTMGPDAFFCDRLLFAWFVQDPVSNQSYDKIELLQNNRFLKKCWIGSSFDVSG